MKSTKRKKVKRKGIPMPVYWKLFIISVVIIFLFLIFIVPALNALNNFSDTWWGRWQTLKNDMSDWFAFWGSFSGAIASVLVGIATIRLTEFQVQLSVAAGMPQMVCKEMKIYSVGRSQINSDYLLKFEDINNYCIVLNLKPCFPPYFDISIDSIRLMAERHSEILFNSISEPLEKGKDYYYSNNEIFKLFINVPKDLDSLIEHFYLLNLETTNATLHKDKNIQIILRFRCSNALLKASVFNKGEVYFDMVLTMESKGKDGDCVKFSGNDIKFVRVRRERIKNEKNNDL